MKLTWRQIDPFIKNPDPQARVILIYGPDHGLVQARGEIIGKTVTPDLNDPFNAVHLDGGVLTDDPARLSDEAQALSMMGGTRLIRVEGAADALTPQIKDYLENPSSENLVLLTAGDLGPRSSLRKTVEAAKNAAALPCYVADARGAGTIIRSHLSEAGYRIEPEALDRFTAEVMGDHGRIMRECEKLTLYMGEEKFITLDHVMDCIGGDQEAALDDFILAVGDGQTAAALNALSVLQAAGTADIIITRALQNHFRRLHMTAGSLSEGHSMEEAVKTLQPPLFFKTADRFKGQASRIGFKKSAAILDRLCALEAACKKTGAAPAVLISQAALAISNNV